MLEVNQLHLDAGGDIWAATNGGALHLDVDTQEYRRFTRVDGLAGNTLLAVTGDDRGHIWFGSDRRGLSRFRPETNSFDPPFLEFRDLRINALLALGDRLYVGTEEGVSLFLIDKEEVKETYRNLGLLGRDSEVIGLGIFDGLLVAGTTLGVAYADLGQPNLQDPDSWLTLGGTEDLVDLLEFEGTLFLAGRFGISSFRSGEYRITFELPNKPATSLGVFEGRVVASLEEGTIFGRDSEGTWERVPGKSISGVSDMSENADILWLATRQGLTVIGGDPPPPSNEPAENHFFDMELLDGELWVASVPDDHQQSFGVYQLGDSGWTVHNRRSGMPTNNLITIEADAEGRVWVGILGRRSRRPGPGPLGNRKPRELPPDRHRFEPELRRHKRYRPGRGREHVDGQPQRRRGGCRRLSRPEWTADPPGLAGIRHPDRHRQRSGSVPAATA